MPLLFVFSNLPFELDCPGENSKEGGGRGRRRRGRSTKKKGHSCPVCTDIHSPVVEEVEKYKLSKKLSKKLKVKVKLQLKKKLLQREPRMSRNQACPVCQELFSAEEINGHLDECLNILFFGE